MFFVVLSLVIIGLVGLGLEIKARDRFGIALMCVGLALISGALIYYVQNT